jgi:hypothetical protein
MKHKCKIVIVTTSYRTPKSCPFDDLKVSLRELSRRTGIDVSYLSKVRAGKATITEEMYGRLMTAIEGAVV